METFMELPQKMKLIDLRASDESISKYWPQLVAREEFAILFKTGDTIDYGRTWNVSPIW